MVRSHEISPFFVEKIAVAQEEAFARDVLNDLRLEHMLPCAAFEEGHGGHGIYPANFLEMMIEPWNMAGFHGIFTGIHLEIMDIPSGSLW